MDAGLPNKYWGEAILMATYLQNRIPSKAVDSIPYELWHESKPSTKYIRVIKCKSYGFIPNEKHSKL